MVQGRILVVAGSDSSGGAGLEADQKVIAAHGCYAMTATTALTAQNTTGVKAVHVIPAYFVRQQVEACVEDIGVDVVKTGMLAAADTIEMLAELMMKYKTPTLVVDPVMVSTSGHQLLPQEAITQLSQHLLPLTTILTPNLPEATLILRHNNVEAPEEFRSVADFEAVARKLQALGPKWVLVKGGHLPFKRDMTPASEEGDREIVVDVLVGPGAEDVVVVKSPWQESTSTHGTGCSLASAIACGLAKGMDPPAAVRSACRYVEAGIRTAPKLGSGHGPLNHFHSTSSLPFSPGYFVEYLLDRQDVKEVWDSFVNHPFVMALGDGSLPLESFKGYIIQDYLYLIHFARANALSAYKSKSMTDISRATEIVAHIMHETKLHIAYCESFDISLSTMEATEEHQGKAFPSPISLCCSQQQADCPAACTAYTRYVLDIGQSEDWLALQMALAPCLLGYAAVAKMLSGHARTKREGNIYWQWIENYGADDYLEAVRLGSEVLEKHIVLQSPSRMEELVKIFIHATKMEIGFWEMFPAI